jgi:hypothetical protein
MALPQCPKTGKHSHKSLEAAQAHLRSIAKHSDAQVEAYWCDACGFVHVGRMSKKTIKSKRMKK